MAFIFMASRSDYNSPVKGSMMYVYINTVNHTWAPIKGSIGINKVFDQDFDFSGNIKRVIKPYEERYPDAMFVFATYIQNYEKSHGLN